MPLTTSLISRWEMNEASGNVLDSHSTNTLVEQSGSIGAAAGPGGVSGSRDFEATDTEYVSIADNASLSLADIDFTIECWVNLESKSARQIFIAKGDGSNGEYYLEYTLTSDRFTFFLAGAAGFGSLGSVAADNLGSPSTGVWYQILVRHDAVGNQIGIRVNNGTENTATYSSTPYDGTGSFRIGGWDNFSLYADGLIAKTSLWKRLLTSQERTDLYNGGNGLAYAAFNGATGGPRRRRAFLCGRR